MWRVVANTRGSKDTCWPIPRVRRRLRAEQQAGRAFDVVHVHHGLTSVATRLVGLVPRVLDRLYADVIAATDPNA